MILWMFAALAGYFVKGVAGIGNTLVVTSLMAYTRTNAEITPVELLLCVPTNLVMAWANRKAINWKLSIPPLLMVLAGDVLGVLLQMAYAVTVGFMFVAIVFKGGSLWPCIISHMVVNGSSVFALEQGPFTQLIASLTGSAAAGTVQAVSAALVMIISGGYALWLWKKEE